MFEAVVAYALNKYLGQFIDNLDIEQLNVGVFNGTIHLVDLHLKPEALAGFDLPIEVKGGSIGKVCIDIPWTSLYSEPILVHIEEVFVLAGPTSDRKHDPERDKCLSRAHKNRRLDDARPPDPDAPGDRPRGFMENLMTTIINNVQVSVQNVHLRYEDTVSTSNPLACGFVLQTITAMTTNSRWRTTQVDAEAKNLFKLIKIESLSLYWNPICPTNTLVKAQLNSDGWKTLLRKGLATFSINGEDFDFILNPVTLKIKMILNKSKEPQVPKLLLDFVLQDSSTKLTRNQYVSMYELSRAFQLMTLSQKYRKYFRGLCVKGHATDYWKDAYTAVMEEYVKPYTWARIKEYRNKYRQYKSMYKEHLHRPTDTELKLDMNRVEDSLDVTSILIAREQAKMEIAEVEPNMVRRVPTRKPWSFWSWFSSTGDETDSFEELHREERAEEEELLIVGDKDRSWWSKMNAEERRRLFEGIGYGRPGPDPEFELNHIGHKLNFTLENCTLSLVNGGKEILVATVTHFLASLETKPGARAYKMSARTESMVIEGASLENDLVPIITADNVTSGSNLPHVFSLDFEKNPSNVNADYGLSVSAEPMEIVYHKYALKALMNFFELPPASLQLLKDKLKENWSYFVESGKEKLITAMNKHKMVHLNVDLRSPYFVIPEHGSLQKGGSVIILDTGRLTVTTDLQSDSVPSEDSTKMETEERLYDRYNVSLSDMQVLFSDLGEEWRTAKQLSETDMHLIPKVKLLLVYSNSVRPDCKTLPRHKLNISLPSLKLNLSDRRVSLIVDFLQNIPVPNSFASNHELSSSISSYKLCKHVLKEPSRLDLREVWRSLHRKKRPKSLSLKEQQPASLSGALQHSFSDQSDGEEEPGGAAERWARIIDLPGFEDNVSASNYIKVLFRLVAGEISIHLARSSDHSDKPYLMLRAEKLCIDAAHMVYGPAVQASLHRIQLVDKLHKGASGEYLELLSSDNAVDMVTILYRKVQASCPEFKSHFHQVEHSLVLDVSTLNVAFHREAFVTIARFLQYIHAKLKPKSCSFKLTGLPYASDLMHTDTLDPPVPPGATKFSISARLNALRVKLCDTDLELADLNVAGFETDYVLKANEKSVLRVNLAKLEMEDLVEDTLYKKILSTEGEKVFDIKWVRRSPHQKEVIEGNNKDSLPIRVDGSIRIRFGRMVIVLLHSFANELHRFLEPFLNPDATTFVKRSTEEKLQQKVAEFQQSGLRYQISVEIQAPTFLLPQKATSPNALILQLGELSVENFFQEEHGQCIDNLLIRLHDLQLARALILLDSKMNVLEPIIEPLKIRLDIKRAIKPCQKDGLLYHISGSMDLIKINIGQRDFSTIMSVYEDNYARLQFFNTNKGALSPDNENGPEESVRKLEVFLYASTDVRRESSLTFILEGLSLTLYTDAEEMRTSNARDPKQALTTFILDEASVSLETTNDKSLELKCSCQAATLLDLRASNSSSLRKIFQSYSGDSGGSTGVAGISLSMPPMVDLSYRRTGNRDASVDAVVEKIRLNVSVSYVLGLMKFVSDALPGSSLPSSSAFLDDDMCRRRLPSDCTSGYLSTISSDDSKALSVSVVFRKPEIVLFAQPDTPNTGVLVLKMDIMLDYNFNLGQGNLLLSFAGLHVLSCIYGRRKHTMCTVLYPCEIELSRRLQVAEEEVKMAINVSNIKLCLSAPVVQTLLEVHNQLFCSFQEAEDKRNYRMEKEQKQVQDLWSPSPIHKQKWTEPERECECGKERFFIPKYAETFSINVPEVFVWCEIRDVVKNIPVLYTKGAFEAEIKDWSSQLNAHGELQLEVMYYNEKNSLWEPLLEQILIQEGQYRPLEIMFKVFRDRAHPMVYSGGDEYECTVRSLATTDVPASLCSSDSSSGNETDDDLLTNTVIKRKMPMRMKRLSSIAKSREFTSFAAYQGDSDSENEDGVLEKIASTFDHLFSDDEEGASDEPPSDSEGIADLDIHSDSGETETADNEDVFDEAAPVYSSPHRHHHHEHRAVDAVSDTALYLTVDCRDTININVTPTVVSVLQEIITEFTSIDSRLGRTSTSIAECKELLLKNSLGPEVTLKILQKEESGQYQVTEEVQGRLSKKLSADQPDLVTPLVDISPADSDSEMAGDDNDGFHMSGISTPALKEIDKLYKEKSIAELYAENTQEKLSIEVETFDKLCCHLPNRSSTTIYALQPVKNKTRYFVLVDTDIFHGQRTITARSPLKIQNHLGRPVYIFCEKTALEAAGGTAEDYSKNPFQDKFIRVTTLEPGNTYDLPLLVAYHCKLYIRPLPTGVDQKGYNLSNEGIWWKDMTVPQKSSTFLQCCAENNTNSVFCVKVVCEENRDLKMPSVGTKLVPNFYLHLYPPLIFHNLLPLTLDIQIKNKEQTMRLKEGESATFFNFDFQQPQEILLEVGQYVGLQWHGKLSVSGDTEELYPISMSPETDTGGGNRHLALNVHINRERSFDLYLFSPYWIVNKTGLPLQFRGSMSDAVYEAALNADPLLFRFKKHRRKKAKLRVYSSQWSRSFSLDTVGNCGVVICADKERNKKYHFFVDVEMSKILLTKVIVIKPFFLVINNTENYLRFMEKNDTTDLWFDIAPDKCLPFWPDTDALKMFVKLRDSKTISQHFPIDFPHVTVLRMECGSALKVEVKSGEDYPTTITFLPYFHGDAPVRVDNYCEDLFLKIHQKSQSQVTLLNPYQSVYYTWDDPSKERTLIWNLYNRKKTGFPAKITKDGYGFEKVSFHSLRKTLVQQPSFNRSTIDQSSSSEDDSESEDNALPKKTRKDKVVVHWVSYVEKGQRVLLFTQDDRIARLARKAVDGERAYLECFLSLSGIGLSLINDVHRELAYASLTSCPAIWEIEINHCWKLLTLELSAWLEDKWNADQQKAQLKDYLQVDLNKMQMIKPFFGHLRRFYSPALWLQLRKSPYQTYAHFKIHRFQIDNQLPDAIFSTVLHPGTTPQYIVRRNGPKPFLESAFLYHASGASKTLKFGKVLVQELHLHIDKGFILSVHDMLSRFIEPPDEMSRLREDLKTAQSLLFDLEQRPLIRNRKKISFEYIHLSPIVIHFSFSPRGTAYRATPQNSCFQGDGMDALSNSIGANLSEVQDVEIKLAFFERRGFRAGSQDLYSEIRSHYRSQAVQQAYVLVLGLDILGNPFGALKDFTRGLGNYFYEPYLGYIKGPDEFAESLARSALTLLGHVIGCSAGAMATNSLGEKFSLLTFDENYRRKRQQRLQLRKSSLPETLDVAARSFVLGVGLALSGVVVQPVTGGQQEGVEGFFRGIGKGLLGLITKPAGGVVDLVSMAFDGIRRAAEMGESVMLRMRLPRYINPSGGLRPYSPYLASGCHLLEIVSKGHYAETDIYWAHAALTPQDRIRVALVTDRHLFLLEKSRLWGGWDIEWLINVEDVLTVPHIQGNNLIIKVKQEDWILNFAGDERYIQSDDLQTLEWLKDKIEKVLLYNMRGKPCPI